MRGFYVCLIIRVKCFFRNKILFENGLEKFDGCRNNGKLI